MSIVMDDATPSTHTLPGGADERRAALEAEVARLRRLVVEARSQEEAARRRAGLDAAEERLLAVEAAGECGGSCEGFPPGK